MDEIHRRRLQADFSRALQHKFVMVLDIPDDYRYMDGELVEILEQSVTPFL